MEMTLPETHASQYKRTSVTAHSIYMTACNFKIFTISTCKPDLGLTDVLTILIQWHVYKSMSQQQASEYPPVESKLRVCIFKTSQDKFYPLTNASPQSTEIRHETQPFSSAQMDANPEPEGCWLNSALIQNSR